MLKFFNILKVVFLAFIFSLTVSLPSQTANSADLSNESCSYIFYKAYNGKKGSVRLISNVIRDLNPGVSLPLATNISSIIIDIAEYYRVDPLLLLSIIKEESGFNSSATSEAGAIGLMQLIPKTAEFISKRELNAWKGQELLVYPRYNVALGTAYFKDLLGQYRDTKLALIAYNIGPSNLDRLLRRKSFDGNSEYSDKVLTTYNKLLETTGSFSELINCSFEVVI